MSSCFLEESDYLNDKLPDQISSYTGNGLSSYYPKSSHPMSCCNNCSSVTDVLPYFYSEQIDE